MNREILIKKIKNKFISKSKKLEKYYKNTYCTYRFLNGIADSTKLKPIKGFLREYQLNLINFLKEQLRIFEELKISYFFISGSLLGAYRNQGFIPWDDDIDIEMMREDFNILIQFLRKNYIEVNTKEIKYSLNNRSFIIKKHIEKHPNQLSFAIFPTHLQILYGDNMESLRTLDIHPCDFFKDDYNFTEHEKYIEYIKQKRNEIDNFYDITQFLEKERINNHNIVKESNTIYYGLDNFDTYYIKTNNWYKKTDIFPLKKIKFEGIEVSVPNNIEKLLEINYGKDYMLMPSKMPLAPHIHYRTQVKVRNSSHKAIILSKIKRKYFRNKYEFLKDLDRDAKIRLGILREIVDVMSLKPTQNKTLREYQLATVKFAKEITNFLEAEKLEYFITSGTLIGAVRHQGFIPWDDDFDIGLMRKDYEKLKKILKEKFILVDTKKISFKKANNCKILDETIKKNPNQLVCYLAPKYIQIYRGESFANCTSVDIFPHEFYKENYTFEEYKHKINKITNNLSYIKNYYELAEYLHKESITDKNVVEKSSKVYYSFDSLGTYIVRHEKFMSYDKIFPRKKIDFEGYEFYAPNDPDDYITVQYKDYMSLPSKIEIYPTLVKHLEQ